MNQHYGTRMSTPLISIPLGHLCNRLLSLSVLTHPITPVVLSSIMTTKRFVKIGVRQKVLKAQLALSNLNVCTRHGISFEIKWIPRSFNYQADLWSRTIHFDDYTIHDEVFHMLDRKWGTHTVVICLPVVITPRFGITIPCFTSLARKP